MSANVLSNHLQVIVQAAGIEYAAMQLEHPDRRRLIGRVRIDNRDTVMHYVQVRIKRWMPDLVFQAQYDRLLTAAVDPQADIEREGLGAVLYYMDELVIETDTTTATTAPSVLLTWEDMVVPMGQGVQS